MARRLRLLKSSEGMLYLLCYVDATISTTLWCDDDIIELLALQNLSH